MKNRKTSKFQLIVEHLVTKTVYDNSIKNNDIFEVRSIHCPFDNIHQHQCVGSSLFRIQIQSFEREQFRVSKFFYSSVKLYHINRPQKSSIEEKNHQKKPESKKEGKILWIAE